MTPVARMPAGLRYGRAFQTARTVKHPSEGPTWLNLVNDLHTTIQLPLRRAKMCASPSGEPRCSHAIVILLPSGGARSLRISVWTRVCSTCSAYGRGRRYGRLTSQGTPCGIQGGLKLTSVDIKLDRTTRAASSRQLP